MSVTNLTGTTWLMNDTVSISSGLSININFKDNELNEYVKFEIIASALLNYFDTPTTRIFAYSPSNGWYYEKFKTIEFIGGEGVTNTDLITWLESNATDITPHPDFYKVTDLELTSVADAIRSAAGISESLTFPSGFISGIENAGGYCNISTKDYIERTYTSVEANINWMRSNAFRSHYSLITASFPNVSVISTYAFAYCSLLTNISFPKCRYIGPNVFFNCNSLTSAYFPNCVDISQAAFNGCSSLATTSFPNCTYISNTAFGLCRDLITVSFPNCSYIGSSAFGYCTSLTTAFFPKCTTVTSSVFYRCYNLISLNFIGISQVPSLLNSNAFESTPIAGYTTSTGGVYGSIYVPSSLLTSFKTATNWTYFSNRMVGV